MITYAWKIKTPTHFERSRDLSHTDLDMDTDYTQQKAYYKLWTSWHLVDVHGEPGSGDSEEVGGEGVGVPEPLQMLVLLLSVILPELGHLLPAHWGTWRNMRRMGKSQRGERFQDFLKITFFLTLCNIKKLQNHTKRSLQLLPSMDTMVLYPDVALSCSWQPSSMTNHVPCASLTLLWKEEPFFGTTRIALPWENKGETCWHGAQYLDCEKIPRYGQESWWWWWWGGHRHDSCCCQGSPDPERCEYGYKNQEQSIWVVTDICTKQPVIQCYVNDVFHS